MPLQRSFKRNRALSGTCLINFLYGKFSSTTGTYTIKHPYLECLLKTGKYCCRAQGKGELAFLVKRIFGASFRKPSSPGDIPTWLLLPWAFYSQQAAMSSSVLPCDLFSSCSPSKRCRLGCKLQPHYLGLCTSLGKSLSLCEPQKPHLKTKGGRQKAEPPTWPDPGVGGRDNAQDAPSTKQALNSAAFSIIIVPNAKEHSTSIFLVKK